MEKIENTPLTNRGVENTSKYPLVIDWLTFSGHFSSFDKMIDFIGLSYAGISFEECPSKWFYKYSMTYNNEITLMMSQTDDITACCFNISGRGCRDIESFSKYNIEDLICNIMSHPDFKVSRVDIAMDVIDEKFSIEQLVKATRKGNFTCRSKFYNIMESSDDGIKGTSLYFGKQKSNIFINIYDKRAERGYKPTDMINWTRLEIRLRHENAHGFCNKLSMGCDIGYLFVGLLNNYLRFVVSSDDVNKSRLPTARYWSKLLHHCEKIKCIDSVGVEYDYSKFENYLFNTCGSSILTYLKNHSVNELVNELSLRGIELNDRQKILVDNYEKGIDFMLLLD